MEWGKKGKTKGGRLAGHMNMARRVGLGPAYECFEEMKQNFVVFV